MERNNRKKAPKQLVPGTFLRRFFSFVQISPRLASIVAYKLFFKPIKKSKGGKPLTGCVSKHIMFNGKKISVYESGSGRPILLVHGWGGSAKRFTKLVERLVDDGFQVVTFDLPGHGASSGSDTDIKEVAAIIQHLSSQYGRFEVLAGHSFGGVCVAYTLSNGASPSRVVLLSTPSSFVGMVDKFSLALGLKERSHSFLVKRIRARLGCVDLEKELGTRDNLVDSNISSLVIHDQVDRVVPYHEGVELGECGEHVRFMPTRGLGHSGALEDDSVLEACVAFIRDGSSAPVSP